MMHIYKRAYPILLLIGALLFFVNIIFSFIQFHLLIHIGLGFFSILLFAFTISFFRVPARNLKPDERVVYSPADGKIMAIDEVFENEYLKRNCKRISVFMSIFNVHQNRVPVSGKVVYSKHHPGKYLVAWHPKSSLKNERQTVVIETPKGELILIRQIAGIVARRIICNVKAGDKVKQGDELGFILFGSRVDVLIPVLTIIKVRMGDKVKANVCSIASF